VTWTWQIAVIVAFLAFALFGRAAFAVPNVANATTDANWIMGAYISSGPMSGAIGTYPDPGGSQHIEPYFDNFAAMGLARAYQITGNTSYINATWSHLAWYANHVDSSGYAHNWDLVNGTWTEEENPGYDSTDSYAATFLIALLAAYRASNNLTELQNFNSAIQTAVNAIHSTQEANGLTDAKPGYTGELLEDNVETYQGLLAAGNLATILGNTNLANQAYGDAAPMAGTINSTMWNSANGWYYWAVFNDGSTQPTNPTTTLSPDLMAQGWTAAFTVATGSRASTVLSLESSFTNSQGKSWDDPATNNNWDVSPMGWGYYFNGEEITAQAAASNIRSEAVAANFAWPYQTADAGELIILETDGEDLLFATPPQPSGLTATGGSSKVTLSWTSTPGANVYNVYRGTSPGGESTTPIASALSSPSYTDTAVTNGTTYYYTIGAFNDIGASPMSAEVHATPSAGSTVTTDLLSNWNIISSKSANWELDTTTPTDFNGDTSRAARTVDDTEYLIYSFKNISTFSAKVYIYIGPIGTATFQVSTNNGSSYSNVTVNTGSETLSANGWGYYTVTPSGALPAGVTNLKVIFASGGNNANWDPELSQISITHQ
jgi:hypothetical protein